MYLVKTHALRKFISPNLILFSMQKSQPLRKWFCYNDSWQEYGKLTVGCLVCLNIYTVKLQQILKRIQLKD